MFKKFLTTLCLLLFIPIVVYSAEEIPGRGVILIPGVGEGGNTYIIDMFCSATTVTWGNGCVSNISDGQPDQTLNVTNTNPGYTGSAVFVCKGGTWHYQDGNCFAHCQSRNVTWGSGCSGTASATQHGQSVPVNNSNSAYSGSAVFVCNNGIFQVTGNSVCYANCSSQSVSWGNCSGSTYSTRHGVSIPVSNTNIGYTGSATYLCNNGSWIRQSESCNRVMCGSQTVYWGSGCYGSVGSGYYGDQRSVWNLATNYSGSATATCDSNGRWSASGSCSYTPPSPPPSSSITSTSSSTTTTTSSSRPSSSSTPPSSSFTSSTCSPGSVSWGIGCSGNISTSGSSGTTVNISNTRSGYTGAATFVCSNGSWQRQSSSCSYASSGQTYSGCGRYVPRNFATFYKYVRLSDGREAYLCYNTQRTGDLGTGTTVEVVSGPYRDIGTCARNCSGTNVTCNPYPNRDSTTIYCLRHITSSTSSLFSTSSLRRVQGHCYSKNNPNTYYVTEVRNYDLENSWFVCYDHWYRWYIAQPWRNAPRTSYTCCGIDVNQATAEWGIPYYCWECYKNFFTDYNSCESFCASQLRY